MSDKFLDLVQRLYDGDSIAAEQIVREHEPEIRRIIRARLRDPRLRRVLDSVDICQSVFGKFFVQARLGRFELNSSQDLVRLLTRMATNKIVDKHRSEASQRRLVDQKRDETEHAPDGENSTEHSPSDQVFYDELWNLAKGKLTEKEHAISNLRNKGMTWLEISRELGESPQALRKRFDRACERLSKELGLS